MYIDAGMELRGRLSQLNDNFSNNGYWFVGASRGGGGAAGSEGHEQIQSLTKVHAGQYEALGVTPDYYRARQSLAAGMIGICRNSSVWDQVFIPWWRCSLRPECIAPRGCNKDNHRWDQSALSVLFHRRSDLNRAAAAPPLFLETSPTYWISRSIISAYIAEQFEKPETHYPGVYFYARRSYYPKPFKGLVQKA